jgi:hypothetical protein
MSDRYCLRPSLRSWPKWLLLLILVVTFPFVLCWVIVASLFEAIGMFAVEWMIVWRLK